MRLGAPLDPETQSMTSLKSFAPSFAWVPCLVLCCVAAAPGQGCVSGVNTALTFDGVDDWARIPDNVALDGFGDFTIEFWCHPASNLNQGLVSKFRHASPSNDDDAYSFRVYPPGVLRVQFASGTVASGTYDGTATLSDGAWHHVAVTRSGDAVSAFVDGALDIAFTFAGPLNATDTPLALAALLDATDSPLRPLAGHLDEVRIWNQHRTQSQVQQDMHQGLSGSEAGLVAYWRLDDGVGQTFMDATPTGADGALGASMSAGADDPSWSFAFPAPIVYCGAIGGGQGNTPEATLLVNGLGVGSAPGPFVVGVGAGSPSVLSWRGIPGAPIVLIVGPFSGGFPIPGVGSLDVGTPPTFSDMIVLFNGFTLPGNLIFLLDPSGAFDLTVTAPSFPSGTTIGYIQGVVGLPGFPSPALRPTAAFRVDIL